MLLAMVSACSMPPDDRMKSSESTVSGTVTYRERVALPPDAVVEVQLLDVSRMDTRATVLSETSFRPEGQVPIPFQLTYDPRAIDPRLSYAVRATIRRGEQALFVTDRHYPVLTRGNADRADLVLVRSGGGDAGVADAELVNTRWMLRTLNGESVGIEDNQRAPFLQFGREDGEAVVHGYGGCNSFRGGYRVEGETLVLGPLAATKRACPDMELESRLYRALEDVSRYSIESTWLMLYGPGGELATLEAWYE